MAAGLIPLDACGSPARACAQAGILASLAIALLAAAPSPVAAHIDLELPAVSRGQAAGEGPAVRALVGASLIDVEAGSVVPDAVIIIIGDRIAAAGASADIAIPPEADRIRMGGRFLLPGLIDLRLRRGAENTAEAAGVTTSQLALRLAAEARHTLEAGVTTVGLALAAEGVELDVKNAIDGGAIAGPRIHFADRKSQPSPSAGARTGVAFQDGHLSVEGGPKPIDALRGVTIGAADLLRRKDIGSLRSGRYADIIAVDGNPLTGAWHVAFVMKGGRIVRSSGDLIRPDTDH